MRALRAGGWVLVVSLAAPAAAQDDGRFNQLVDLLEPGDGVRVTFSGGRERKVRVVGVTPETLSVVTRGGRLDLGEEDVWFVHRRVSDPTRNGGWIGFAAGAAAGMWYLYGFCFGGSDSCTPSPGARNFALVGSLFGGGGRMDRRRRRPPDRAGGGGLAATSRPRLERHSSRGSRSPRGRRLAELLNRPAPTGARTRTGRSPRWGAARGSSEG